MSFDYTDSCGNCREYMEPGDRYCRYCGTKRGEGAFDPEDEIGKPMDEIYGPPPVFVKHCCVRCGYSWTDLSYAQRYCPMCGGQASYF